MRVSLSILLLTGLSLSGASGLRRRLPAELSAATDNAVRAAAGDADAVREALERQHAPETTKEEEFVIPQMVESFKADEPAEKEVTKVSTVNLDHPIAYGDVKVPESVDKETFDKLGLAKDAALAANGRVVDLLSGVVAAKEHADEVQHNGDARIRSTISRIDQHTDEIAAARRRHAHVPVHTRKVVDGIVNKPLANLAYASERQRQSVVRHIEGVEDAANFDSPLLVTHDLCHNGRQDPGEAGVDCGGPCAPCMIDPTIKDAVDRANADADAKHHSINKPAHREHHETVTHHVKAVAADAKDGRVVVSTGTSTLVMADGTKVTTESAEEEEEEEEQAPVSAPTGAAQDAMTAVKAVTEGADGIPPIPEEMVESTGREAELVERQTEFLNKRQSEQVYEKARLDKWEHALEEKRAMLDKEEEALTEAEAQFAEHGGIPKIPEAPAAPAATAAAEEKPVKKSTEAAQLAEEAATAAQAVEDAEEEEEEESDAEAAARAEAAEEADVAAEAEAEAEAELDTDAAAAPEATATTGSTGSTGSADATGATDVMAQDDELADTAVDAVDAEGEDAAAADDAAGAFAFRRTSAAISSSASDDSLSAADADEAAARRELEAAERTLERLEAAGVPAAAFLQLSAYASEGPSAEEKQADANADAIAQAATAGMSAEEQVMHRNLEAVRQFLQAQKGATGGAGLDDLFASVSPELRVKLDELKLKLSDSKQKTELMLHDALRSSDHMEGLIANATVDAARLRTEEAEGQRFSREQMMAKAAELEAKALELETENEAERVKYEALWEGEQAEEEQALELKRASELENAHSRATAAVREVTLAASKANETIIASHDAAVERLEERIAEHKEKLEAEGREHELQASHQEMLRKHIAERRNVSDTLAIEHEQEEERAANLEMEKADEEMAKRKERFQEVEKKEKAAQKAEDDAVKERVDAAKAAAKTYTDEVDAQEKADAKAVKDAKVAVQKLTKQASDLEKKEQELAKKADKLAERRQQVESEAAQHARSLDLATEQERQIEARLVAVQEQQATSAKWEAQALKAEATLKKMQAVPKGSFLCDDGTYVFDALNCPAGGPMAKEMGEERDALEKEAEDARKEADEARKEAVKAANEDVVKRLKAALGEAQKAIKLHEAEAKKLEAEAKELADEQADLVKEGEEAEKERREADEKRQDKEVEALNADQDDQVQLLKLREARDRLQDEEREALRAQQERTATRDARRRERMERFEEAYHAYEVARAAELRRIKERSMEIEEDVDKEHMSEEELRLHDELLEKKLNSTLGRSASTAREQAMTALLRAREAIEASRVASMAEVERTKQAAMEAIAMQRDAESTSLNTTTTLRTLTELHREQAELRREQAEEAAANQTKVIEERHLEKANASRTQIKTKLEDARSQLTVVEKEMETDLQTTNKAQLDAAHMEAAHEESSKIIEQLELAKKAALEARDDAPLVRKAKKAIETNKKTLDNISAMYTEMRISAAERRINEVKSQKAAREAEAKRRVEVAKKEAEAAGDKSTDRVDKVKSLLREAVDRALDQDMAVAKQQQATVDEAMHSLDVNADKAAGARTAVAAHATVEDEMRHGFEAEDRGQSDDESDAEEEEEEDATGATGMEDVDHDDLRFQRMGETESMENMEMPMMEQAPFASTDGIDYTPSIPDSLSQAPAFSMDESLQGSMADAYAQAGAPGQAPGNMMMGRRLLGLRGGKRGSDFRFRQLTVPATAAASPVAAGPNHPKAMELLRTATDRIAAARAAYEVAKKDVDESKEKLNALMTVAVESSASAVSARGAEGTGVSDHLDAVEKASAEAAKMEPIVAAKEHAAATAHAALEKAEAAMKEVDMVLHPEKAAAAAAADAAAAAAVADATGATGGAPTVEVVPGDVSPLKEGAATAGADAGGDATVGSAVEKAEAILAKHEAAVADASKAGASVEEKAHALEQLTAEVRKLRAEMGEALRQEHADLAEKRKLADKIEQEALEAVSATGDVPEDLAVAAAAASETDADGQPLDGQSKAAALWDAEAKLTPEEEALKAECPCAIKPVCACKMQKRSCGCKANSPCGCDEDFCPCGKFLPCGCAMNANTTAPVAEPEVPTAVEAEEKVEEAKAEVAAAAEEKMEADNSTIEATVVIHRYPTRTEILEDEEAKAEDAEKKALEDEAEAAEKMVEAERERVAVEQREVGDAAEAEREARTMREKLVERVTELREVKAKEEEVREAEVEEKKAAGAEVTVKHTLSEKVDKLHKEKKVERAMEGKAEEKKIAAKTVAAEVEEVEEKKGGKPKPVPAEKASAEEASVVVSPKHHVVHASAEATGAAQEEYTPVEINVSADDVLGDRADPCNPLNYQSNSMPADCPSQAPLRSIPTETPMGAMPGPMIPSVSIKPSAQIANEPVVGDQNTWAGFNGPRGEQPFGTYVPTPENNVATSFLQLGSRVVASLKAAAGYGVPGSVRGEYTQAEAQSASAQALDDVVTEQREGAGVMEAALRGRSGKSVDPNDVGGSTSNDMVREALESARGAEQMAASQVAGSALDATVAERLSQGAEPSSLSDEGMEAEKLIPSLPQEISGDKMYAETREWLSKYDPDIHPGVALSESGARLDAVDASWDEDKDAVTPAKKGDGVSLERMQDDMELQREQEKTQQLNGEIADLLGKMPGDSGAVPALNDPMP